MKLLIEGTYAGHNSRKDGTIIIKFNFPYVEVAKYIHVVQMLMKGIKVGARIDDKKFPLGRMMVNRLVIDKEGEATLYLESEITVIEIRHTKEFINQQFTVVLNDKEAN